MKKPILATFALLLLQNAAFFQTNAEIKWTTVISKNQEFAISIPSDFVVHAGGEFVELSAAAPDLSIGASISRTEFGKMSLKSNRDAHTSTETSFTSSQVGKFLVDLYITKKTTYRVQLYVASESDFFSIDALARDANVPALSAFLKSVTLDGRPVFNLQNAAAPKADTRVNAKDLKSSPAILDALKHNPTGKIEVLKKQSGQEPEEQDILYSRRLMVLTQPRAGFTSEARQDKISGDVELQIMFKGDGDIGSIRVLKGLTDGLTSQAIEAAKKIKFLPAQLEGKPIDVTRKMVYTFTIY